MEQRPPDQLIGQDQPISRSELQQIARQLERSFAQDTLDEQESVHEASAEQVMQDAVLPRPLSPGKLRQIAHQLESSFANAAEDEEEEIDEVTSDPEVPSYLPARPVSPTKLQEIAHHLERGFAKGAVNEAEDIDEASPAKQVQGSLFFRPMSPLKIHQMAGQPGEVFGDDTASEQEGQRGISTAEGFGYGPAASRWGQQAPLDPSNVTSFTPDSLLPDQVNRNQMAYGDDVGDFAMPRPHAHQPAYRHAASMDHYAGPAKYPPYRQSSQGSSVGEPYRRDSATGSALPAPGAVLQSSLRESGTGTACLASDPRPMPAKSGLRRTMLCYDADSAPVEAFHLLSCLGCQSQFKSFPGLTKSPFACSEACHDARACFVRHKEQGYILCSGSGVELTDGAIGHVVRVKTLATRQPTLTCETCASAGDAEAYSSTVPFDVLRKRWKWSPPSDWVRRSYRTTIKCDFCDEGPVTTTVSEQIRANAGDLKIATSRECAGSRKAQVLVLCSNPSGSHLVRLTSSFFWEKMRCNKHARDPASLDDEAASQDDEAVDD